MKHHHKFSRREFISRGLTGVAGACLSSPSLRALSSTEEQIKSDDPEGKIIYRTLGKTDIRLPIVSMGAMNCYSDALIKRSYEIGVRYFDTSAWYRRGGNEMMIGKALKELNVRDEVIIGTKVYVLPRQRHMTPEEAKQTYLSSVDESLKRLQTDYIDILYSHDVNTLDWLNNPGILEALQLLKEQKKTRYIGFSTHNAGVCISDAVRTNSYDVILTRFNYAMGDDRDVVNLLKKAASKGIGLIAMKTQCPHYYYRSMVESSPEKSSFYKGNIMHTAVLKWALRNDFITTAIPGYTNYKQMEEDFSVASNLDYTSEEKKFLEDRNARLSLGYCHQCNECIASCPCGVDIPALMRTHMYATCYANFYQARDALDQILEGKGLTACISCNRCEAECVHRIDIARRIDELKAIYA